MNGYCKLFKYNILVIENCSVCHYHNSYSEKDKKLDCDYFQNKEVIIKWIKQYN